MIKIYGDAALLEMQTHFYFNDFVIPICLPSPSGTPLPKDRGSKETSQAVK